MHTFLLQEDYGYTNYKTTCNFGISTHNLIMCAYPKVIRGLYNHSLLAVLCRTFLEVKLGAKSGQAIAHMPDRLLRPG